MTIDFRVEFAFGYGVNDDPGSDWTDVTDDVRHTSPAAASVVARSGRESKEDGITPGTCSFVLENSSGDYNPENASGPYYGDLKIGVPVRLVTVWSETVGETTTVYEKTRWSGFVSSPWAQQVQLYDPVVEVQAHDLFGLMAAGTRDWPDGYESVIQRSSIGDQVAWWRPGATDWTDTLGRRQGRWTALPSEVVSPVPGAENAWAIPWTEDSDGNAVAPVGHGVLPELWDAALTGAIVFSIAWVAPGTGEYSVFTENTGERRDLSSWGSSDTIDTCGLAFYDDGLEMILPNADGDLAWVQSMERAAAYGAFSSGDARDWSWMQDGLHHILVVMPDQTIGTSYTPGVWIDGVQEEFTTSELGKLFPASPGYTPHSSKTRGTFAGGELRMGAPGVGVSELERLGGWIDHFVVWEEGSTTTADYTALAEEMWAALHTREQTLDERITDIATVAGIDVHLGTLASSGITTLQAYTPGSPVELLQQVEDTEQGRIWVDQDGELRFARRQWSWEETESNTSQLLITDDGTTLDGGGDVAEPLQSGSLVTYDPNITNRAEVNSTYGRQQTYEDAASIATYGIRNPITLTGLLHGQDSRSLSIAEWLVLSAGDPGLKVKRLALRVEDGEEAVLAAFAQDVEEGWLISWSLDLAGTTVAGSGHVIGMTHEWTGTGWFVYLDLDPTRSDWSFFTWGTSEWDGTEGWAF